ncbi:MAG TPA: hypothetical protein VII94_02035 [Candidatus Saccharimonadales bacterium]
MHYHIYWGLKTDKDPFVLNFSEIAPAIDKFISLVKEMEGLGAKDRPPPFEEVRLDDHTFIIRMITDLYKYILVYCDNKCNDQLKAPTDPLSLN